MHRFIFALTFLLSFGLILFAQEKTFKAEYTNNLNELDSKITLEILALNRAKMDLIFQIHNYIDSTDLSKDKLALNSEEIKTLIPCVVEVDIIEETWSKQEYYINLKSRVDNTLLLNRLDKSSRIKEEVDRILKLKNRANNANIQIETLKRITKSDTSHKNKFQLQLEYFKNINVLKEIEYFQKGYLAYLRMEHDTSISYLTKMIDLNPDNDFGYYNIALNYSAQGNDDNAISYYKKALKITPSFAEANYNLGVLYAKNGNEYNANRYLQKAARLNHQKAKELLRPK